MDFMSLNKELGNADLLLIDQILKGRFQPGMKILDAGCGEGRNMVYFVRNNFSIYGIDKDPAMVSMAKLIAQSNNRNFVVENIQAASIEENPFPDEFFDIILCISVLHFSNDADHFMSLIESQARILKKGGLMYISMESDLVKEASLNSVKEAGEPRMSEVKFRMTSELVEKILSSNILVKNESVRTIHIENSIQVSGIWLRKI
jgi:2-polyprenyl-3-methyl-5-hydroxy-6-metoxy-1,4-benzoquinol methylase